MKKEKVFISGVMGETFKEREIAWEIFNKFNYLPLMKANYQNNGDMVLFSDETVDSLIQESDYFFGIIGKSEGIILPNGDPFIRGEIRKGISCKKEGLFAIKKISNRDSKVKEIINWIEKRKLSSFEYSCIEEYVEKINTYLISSPLKEISRRLVPEKVFISLSAEDYENRENKDFIEEILKILKELGLTPIIYEDDFRAKHKIDDLMRDAIYESALVILFASKNAFESDGVLKEIYTMKNLVKKGDLKHITVFLEKIHHRDIPAEFIWITKYLYRIRGESKFWTKVEKDIDDAVNSF